MDKPIIRPVEAFPMEQQDQTVICLRDPSGLAPDPMVLGMGAYFLVTLFDGTNSTLDLQAAFSHRFGEVIPSEKIRELVSALDHAYFLDSPAFAERVRGVREEFRQSPSRPARCRRIALSSSGLPRATLARGAGTCLRTRCSIATNIQSSSRRSFSPGRWVSRATRWRRSWSARSIRWCATASVQPATRVWRAFSTRCARSLRPSAAAC